MRAAAHHTGVRRPVRSPPPLCCEAVRRPAASARTKGCHPDEDCRDQEALADVLRGERPHRGPVRIGHQQRSVDPVQHRGYGPVHPVPHGPCALPPGDERPEVRAHPGHRRGRQDDPPRHVLPDERQLLLRRLLQGRGDPLRVAAADAPGVGRRTRVRSRSPLGHRPPRRCGDGRPVAGGDIGPARAHPVPRQRGQLLAHRPARPRRLLLRDLLRPRPRLRIRGGTGGRRGPVHRDLEPRVHGVRAVRRAVEDRLRHQGRSARQEHRHRHGSGARRVPQAGRREHVRDRRGVPRHQCCEPPLRAGVRCARGRRRPHARRRRPRALGARHHRRWRPAGQ